MSILQPADPIRSLALPAGGKVALTLRRSARARHILIKIDCASGEAELVLPTRASVRDGLAFARKRADWIEDRLSALPAAVPFRAGTVLPLLGKPLLLGRPLNGTKRVRRVDGLLEVPGTDSEFAERVRRWLVTEARREIGMRSEVLAARIDRSIRCITIRDTATRWGSCSAAGRLSFSWRLILAPPGVLNYVVAHEVAHLREMNHNVQFWRLVAELVGDPAAERGWLRQNGSRLRRYGR